LATFSIQGDAPGFQKHMVHGVIVHAQQMATVDVHLATRTVELRTLVRRRLLKLGVNNLFLMNVSRRRKKFLMGKR
jgi:hypothetical protein